MDSSSKFKSPISLYLLIFKYFSINSLSGNVANLSWVQIINKLACACCWNINSLIPGCVAIFHEFLKVHITRKLPVLCLIKLKTYYLDVLQSFISSSKSKSPISLPQLFLNWNSFYLDVLQSFMSSSKSMSPRSYLCSI